MTTVTMYPSYRPIIYPPYSHISSNFLAWAINKKWHFLTERGKKLYTRTVMYFYLDARKLRIRIALKKAWCKVHLAANLRPFCFCCFLLCKRASAQVATSTLKLVTTQRWWIVRFPLERYTTAVLKHLPPGCEYFS